VIILLITLLHFYIEANQYIKLTFMKKYRYIKPFVLLLSLHLLVNVYGCKKKEKTEISPGQTIKDTISVHAAIPEDTSMVFIAASHPNIQYTGRIDYRDINHPTFAFPGVSIKARFEGKAVNAIIKDQGTGTSKTINYFAVIIDGKFTKSLQVNNKDTIYSLGENLSEGEHTIELFKRTEASVGKASFGGFMIRKNRSLLLLPDKPSRKIEFIGDSFTCGYGNDVSYTTGTNTDFHSVNENNYAAWGAIVSRTLNTQYLCTAVSGRGIYRNNSGATIGILPSFYQGIYPDENYPQWNPNAYIPDVVVIHIGTNDFFPEQWATPAMVDSVKFVTAYKNFVTTLRNNYPSAQIVCIVPNSLSNWWPAGFNSLDRIKNYTQAVVNTRKAAGDNSIFSFQLTTQTAPFGEDWHPSNATHESMANQILPYLRSITGW
jgi:lysophospholipase L1-like esterase